MTSTDRITDPETRSISLELDLNHPPEKVWRALTEPALLSEWLLPVLDLDLELEQGATFTFKTHPYPGWDGIVNCRILEIETHRKLSYAWTVPFLDTVVTFTLTPTVSGTQLSIVQPGFKAQQKREFGGARYGWNMMSGKLVDLLARVS